MLPRLRKVTVCTLQPVHLNLRHAAMKEIRPTFRSTDGSIEKPGKHARRQNADDDQVHPAQPREQLHALHSHYADEAERAKTGPGRSQGYQPSATDDKER